MLDSPDRMPKKAASSKSLAVVDFARAQDDFLLVYHVLITCSFHHGLWFSTQKIPKKSRSLGGFVKPRGSMPLKPTRRWFRASRWGASGLCVGPFENVAGSSVLPEHKRQWVKK